jgi:phosphoadenosine phosphosulfate reductase
LPDVQFSGGRCAATKLAIELDPNIPILFLDTGYHFAETYAYRDRSRSEWNLNLINLLPEKTVAEQELEHGLLYQSAPDQCCKLRKVEPLFKAVAEYRVWLTGLRREQAKSRAALEESALFTLPAGKQVLKLAPLAEWTTRDVWYACEQLSFHCCRCMSAAIHRLDVSPVHRFRSIPTIRDRALGRSQGGMRHSH